MKNWLSPRLAELESLQSLREPEESTVHRSGAEQWLDACSNDYLGLGAGSVSRETLDRVAGCRVGAGASRLVQGSFLEHEELESELSDWLGSEAALLTASAFAANASLLPAIADQESLIVSDALNHASIVDGCRLARARVVITPHLEVQAVEDALRGHTGNGPAWVVTEGLFSMDGDSPDLVRLRALCDAHEAGLVVDEAHSLGVLGPAGAGAAVQAGVKPDVTVAGLGKAVGFQGGVIASTSLMRRWLWNRTRSFVFSTALSPAVCRVALQQVRACRKAEAARRRLALLGAELRNGLAARGLPLAPGLGPIVPLVLGSNERVLRATQVMRERGILVQGIRPPTVPAGAARLRLTVHANWPDDAVGRIVAAAEAACAS